MGPVLPRSFLERPIAHRALHDMDAGRPENSLAAVRAAVEGGYGIEIDLQPSAEGAAMVFHDYDMARLMGVAGAFRTKTSAELAGMPLLGGSDGAPTLAAVLDVVAGQVPLLIEVKDQDGAMGPNVGELEAAAVQALQGYDGPVAVMSFNPHSVAALAELAPHLPRGLTTSNYDVAHWPLVPAARRTALAAMEDLDRVGASFISHQADDLSSPVVAQAAASGRDILCWTIRSPEAEAKARHVAANVTFEGYLPA